MKKTSMKTPAKKPEVLISFRIEEDLMADLRIVSAQGRFSSVPKFLRELIRQAVAKKS